LGTAVIEHHPPSVSVYDGMLLNSYLYWTFCRPGIIDTLHVIGQAEKFFFVLPYLLYS